jgi:hypothetical protein
VKVGFDCEFCENRVQVVNSKLISMQLWGEKRGRGRGGICRGAAEETRGLV